MTTVIQILLYPTVYKPQIKVVFYFVLFFAVLPANLNYRARTKSLVRAECLLGAECALAIVAHKYA